MVGNVMLFGYARTRRSAPTYHDFVQVQVHFYFRPDEKIKTSELLIEFT